MFVQVQCALCGKKFDHDCSSLSPTAECPHCGKSNPVAAPALPKAAAPVSGAPSPGSGGVKPCPACHVEIETNAALCIHCGYNFATQQKIGGKSWFAANQKLVLFAGAGLFVLALGAAYLLWPEAEASRPFVPSAAPAAAKPAAPAPPAAPAAPSPAQPEPAATTAAPAGTNAPAKAVAPPPGPAPEELAAQKAQAERAALAALQEKKFESEQNLRIQLDTREPLYGQNELVELRRKNGLVDKGTLTGFSGEGTNRVALVATALGEVGVPFASLDPASRRRVDPEFREAFIQHLLDARFAPPAGAAAE